MDQNCRKSRIEAAKSGDEAAFAALVEPLGRELSAYAYRMLGGFGDAEDAVQETRLKMWRGLAGYEIPAAETGADALAPSFRAWAYRILTNTCLDLLRARGRRVLPQDVCAPVAPGPPTMDVRTDVAWLEPYPDALLPESRTPEARAQQRESIRLAFVRAMQSLPARQRAALILHDVLDFRAAEVAEILETTVAAVNSALQRARATVARPADPPGRERAEAEAVARFVQAWETGRFDALVAMLAEDAKMNMPPWPYWLDGKDAVAACMQHELTWGGAPPRPGRYRILTASLNGQPAGLAYVPGNDGRYTLMCTTVLDLDASGHVRDLVVFVDKERFVAWGFPRTLEEPLAS